MQTSIAQTAALTIFGNDLIHGHSRVDFWPASTVFKHCKHVRFVTFGDDPKSRTEDQDIFANDPVQWLADLRRAEVIGFRLHHSAVNDLDRLTAGFVDGGGRWVIETLYPTRSDLWEATWVVQDQDDPERKIWDVSYWRVARDRAHLRFSAKSLVALARELMVVLTRIDALATRNNLENFAEAFRSAKSVLNSADPLSKTYHFDLAPTSSISLEAKQLLAAGQLAWVFGGMGSWNDIVVEASDQEEYIQVSNALFSLLGQAICSAVTSAAAGRV